MEIKIYYQDTDCGGVVYYANYLTYFERARTEWMESKGLSIKNLSEEGTLFVISHAEADYKSPARYGETIIIDVEPGGEPGIRTDLKYIIKEKISGRLLATGKTTMVCVDKNMRPKKMPPEIKEKMCAGETFV